MKQKPDPTQRSDYALGLSFRKAIVHIADKSARARMSLLLDLLGNDRSLLAPLRHLVESPKFQELMNAPSEAARAIGRDSLLAELGSWCNRETMERLETFLAGTLGIPFPEEAINSTNPRVPAPNAATPTNSYRDESIQSQEGIESEPKARESSADREKDDLHSLEERISILREKAHGASLCGKHQEAIEFLTEALRLDPAKASLYMQRASLHAKNQDSGSAIQDFTTVLRLEPGNIDALAQRGLAHAQLGDTKQAIDDWEKAAESKHDESLKWISSHLLTESKSLFESGDHHGCIKSLTKAIRFAPSNTELYLQRGQAYQAIASLHLAVQDYSAAVRLDPTSGLAYALRGKAYKHQGNQSAAIQDWKTAKKLGVSEATEWLLELTNHTKPPASKGAEETSSSASPTPPTNSQKTVSVSEHAGAITAIVSFLLIIAFASMQDPQTSQPPTETPINSPAASIDGKSLVQERLNTARNHAESAVLMCEHQKVIDALDGVDFSNASPSEAGEKINLLKEARAAIGKLDAPGRSKYWEDCQTGIGFQPFDSYTWEYGNDYNGSLFATASKKCRKPAIQVNAFSDSQLSNRIYSEWIPLSPNPESGVTEKAGFRIPASSLPTEGSIWFDYRLRCND